jgi:hypothetical protein
MGTETTKTGPTKTNVAGYYSDDDGMMVPKTPVFLSRMLCEGDFFFFFITSFATLPRSKCKIARGEFF